MNNSAFLKDSSSILQLPLADPSTSTQLSSPYSIVWTRKVQPLDPRRYNSHHEYQKLYQIVTSQKKSKDCYECTPFDVGCTILGQIKKMKEESSSVLDSSLSPTQYKFGPIQACKGDPKLLKNLDVEFVINENAIKKGKINITSELNSHNQESSHKNFLIQIQISLDNLTFQINCDKNRLSLGPDPFIRIFSEEETCLQVYIEHEKIKLLQFLRKVQIYDISGKYLRIICQSRQHKNYLLYQILGLCSENSLSSSNLCPETNFYATTFGRNHLKIKSMLRESSLQTFSQSKSNLQINSKSEENEQQKDIPVQNAERQNQRQKKSLERSFHSKSKSKHSEDYSNDERMQSFNDDFDKLFSGGHVSDHSGLSPSEHIMEELYNILYTPYSRSRKHSFSGVVADAFLKESKSDNSISRKKSLKAIKQSDTYQINLKSVKTALEDKQKQQISHSQNKNFLTPEKEPLCQQFKPFNQPNKYCNFVKSKPSSTYESPQFVSSRHSFATNQAITFTIKEQQLNKKIDELKKVVEKLTSENIELKRMLKEKNNLLKKEEMNKMKEIKQMAVDLVKRLECAEDYSSSDILGDDIDFLNEDNKNLGLFMPPNKINKRKERYFETENPITRNPTFSDNKDQRKNKRSQSLLLGPALHTTKRPIQNAQPAKVQEMKTKKKQKNIYSSSALQKYHSPDLTHDRLFEQPKSHHMTHQNSKNKYSTKKNQSELSMYSIPKNKVDEKKLSQSTRNQINEYIAKTAQKKEKIPKFLKFKEQKIMSSQLHPKIIVPNTKMSDSHYLTAEEVYQAERNQVSNGSFKREHSGIVNKYVNKGHIILNYYNSQIKS